MTGHAPARPQRSGGELGMTIAEHLHDARKALTRRGPGAGAKPGASTGVGLRKKR